MAYLEGTCIKPPMIVWRRYGMSPYEIYLDSPLGYEFQAAFDTRDEAEDWAWEHAEDLWR